MLSTPPINAFHGTPYRFTRFQCPAGGIHFGTYDQAAHAATLKLARMPADQFAALPEGQSGFRGVIMQVRLHVQNIKRVRDARTPAAWSRCIRKARHEGFDALVYQNDYEGREPADSFVVFDPDRIEILASDS